MNTRVRYSHVAPQFVVKDVEASVAFYSAALGFNVDYRNGEPPQYAVVCRDEVYIHLSAPDHPAFAAGAGSVFIVVSGIDQLWSRIETSFPEAVHGELEDRDYGQSIRFRVFCLVDPDGNILRIGEPLDADVGAL